MVQVGVYTDLHLLLELLLLIHYGSGHTDLPVGYRHFAGQNLRHAFVLDEHGTKRGPSKVSLADTRTDLLSSLKPQVSPETNWTTAQFFYSQDANQPMRSRIERHSDTIQSSDGVDILFTKHVLTNSQHSYTGNKDVPSDHFSSPTNRVRHRRATSNLRRSLNRSSEQTFKADVNRQQETQDSKEENSELIVAESSSRRERQAGKGPYFDPKSPKEVKVAIGTTAHVPCMARNIGTKPVSWIRNRDLHVLTVGAFSFTTDERFSAHRDTITKDWVLIIQHTGLEDSGGYECSVPTKPVTSHTVQLRVLVPRTELMGTAEVHLERGSSLNLTCLVHDSPAPPEFILWYHKDKLVNYGSSSGSISSGSSVGSPGAARVRVQTSHLRDTSRSSLLVQNATTRDSGRYHCEPSNAPKAVALVHVIPSEDPAAMQTTNSAHAPAPAAFMVVTTLLCILLAQYLSKRSRLQPSQARSCSASSAPPYYIEMLSEEKCASHKQGSIHGSDFRKPSRSVPQTPEKEMNRKCFLLNETPCSSSFLQAFYGTEVSQSLYDCSTDEEFYMKDAEHNTALKLISSARGPSINQGYYWSVR